MTFTFVKRSLLKRPFLNLIKVTSLVVSMSSLILISLFLRHQLTFDAFHPAAERIYRFTTTSPNMFGGKHFARVYGASYIPEMAETMPGIEEYLRLSPVGGGIIQWEEKKIVMRQSFECDSTFFELFDIPLISGDPDNVLVGPGSAVISESFAKKIFGDTDPVGQILTIPQGRYHAENSDYVVNGVMKDLPGNSHFHPEFIASPFNRTDLEDWSWIYLLLQPKADPGTVTSLFRDFLAGYNEQDPDEITLTAHLQRLTDIHLRSNKTREIEPNSNILVVYSFVVAAVILLFVALINYFNLNLGMEGFSSKYMFISKVLGSTRSGRLKHFIAEGVIIVILAGTASAIAVNLVNSLIAQRFDINLLEGSFWYTLGITFLLFVWSFLAGFFPHMRLLVKGNSSKSVEQSGGRSFGRGIQSGLVVFQYTIGIVLIVSVLVIQRQTALALKSGIGAENDNVVCVEYVHSDITEKFEEFKLELLDYPSIESVSAMFASPGEDVNDLFRFSMEGYEVDETINADNYIGIFPCDYSFPSLFDLHFLAGTDFSKKFSDSDGSGEYIINETAMRRLRHTDPREIVNKEFQLFFHTDDITIPSGRIVGVVRDFHISSLKRNIEPLVLFKRRDIWIDNLVVSFSPGMQKQAMSDFEKVWNEMYQGHTFRFDYVDSIYSKVYFTERLQSALLMLFTVFALFICSMGLLGLSLLTTQLRTKEIGIRIVNGAEKRHIVTMLNWDFLKWILLSYLLALPISYLAMKRWLEDFVYKTELSWWIFLLAGVMAFIIAGVTVTVHSWKAATRNPVEALRYE